MELAELLSVVVGEVHRGLPAPDKQESERYLDPTTAAAEAEAGIATHCPQLADLSTSVRNGTVRDHEFTPDVYSGAYSLLLAGWVSPALVLRHRVLYIFTKLSVLPEFDCEHPAAAPPPLVIQTLFDQLGGKCPASAEHPYLHQIFFWAYKHFSATRATLRALSGKCLREFWLVGDEQTAVSVILDVLQHVIEGFQVPLRRTHLTLFQEVLLPLHQPNRKHGGVGQGAVVPAGMPGSAVDGQPLLAQYHNQLVRCLTLFDDHQSGLAGQAADYILRHWPDAKSGVSSKEVLLIHELDTLLERTDDDNFTQLAQALIHRLVRCITGAFAQLAQRALQMWKKELFAKRIADVPNAIPQLIVACYRGGKPHWNATVNRLSVTVLDDLRSRDSDTFEAVCNSRIKPDGLSSKGTAKLSTRAKCIPSANVESPGAPQPVRAPTRPLQPPPKRPLTAAGFMPTAAPWAKAKVSRWTGGTDQPPATITGVAPWAQSARARPPPARLPMHPSVRGGVEKASPMALPEDEEVSESEELPPDGMDLCEKEDSVAKALEEQVVERDATQELQADTETHVDESPATGHECVIQFMDAHRGVAQDPAAVTDANAMKLTPTFLPALKFHELVFGHDLGSGAFSTVRHAKHVDRGKPGSQWSQYAVKLISISKIEEHGYEASVSREIAILRVMSHPGIARMVAHFRWRDGAYLVLEYAAKGDLHSYIVANGSLDPPSARFISGEVLAALDYVHNAGFAFSDLKSENVVLMESGHAKITDFGGARPLSEAARSTIEKGRLAVRQLPSGEDEWRIARDRELAAERGEAEPASTPAPAPTATDGYADTRIEGTAAFLAPEIVRGGQPSCAGDSWAFGCLVYQMLAGRPPVWAETVRDAVEAIVQFETDGAKFPESFPDPARALVAALLDPSPTTRGTLPMVASHEFFEGMDVHTLYSKQAPELAAGAVAPTPDAKWARRQNSMLWQPMPTALSASSTQRGAISGLAFEAIPETARESEAPFVTSMGSVAERFG